MDRAAEMEVFVKVAEELSFSAAARGLNQTPSAVSRQIARLEDRLGVRLFNRTTRRISLTDLGIAFHERCTRILADMEEAERAVSQLDAAPRGRLRVTSSIAFAQYQLVPVLPTFLEQYPEVQIDLVLSDTIVDMIDEQVDLAVRIARLPDSAMIARKLADNRRAVVAAPSYLQRRGRPQNPADLAQHDCLLFSNAPTLNTWHFDGPDGRQSVHVKGRFEANSGFAIYEAAIQGLGIARLSTFLIGEDIRAGRLVRLMETWPDDADSSIYAVYPHRRHLSPKVRAFVDFLAGRFGPTPPWECS